MNQVSIINRAILRVSRHLFTILTAAVSTLTRFNCISAVILIRVTSVMHSIANWFETQAIAVTKHVHKLVAFAAGIGGVFRTPGLNLFRCGSQGFIQMTWRSVASEHFPLGSCGRPCSAPSRGESSNRTLPLGWERMMWSIDSITDFELIIPFN